MAFKEVLHAEWYFEESLIYFNGSSCMNYFMKKTHPAYLRKEQRIKSPFGQY